MREIENAELFEVLREWALPENLGTIDLLERRMMALQESVAAEGKDELMPLVYAAVEMEMAIRYELPRDSMRRQMRRMEKNTPALIRSINSFRKALRTLPTQVDEENIYEAQMRDDLKKGLRR